MTGAEPGRRWLAGETGKGEVRYSPTLTTAIGSPVGRGVESPGGRVKPVHAKGQDADRAQEGFRFTGPDSG